jgi:hypothetical protein
MESEELADYSRSTFFWKELIFRKNGSTFYGQHDYEIPTFCLDRDLASLRYDRREGLSLGSASRVRRQTSVLESMSHQSRTVPRLIINSILRLRRKRR